MKKEVIQLQESIRKKLKQLNKDGAVFDDSFVIKYFGKPAQKLYRDFAISSIANVKIINKQKQKRKGKKHYQKKVR